MSSLAASFPVDFSQPSFWKSALVTALCPTIWNILAQSEYYYGVISKLFCGNKLVGAYALAAWILGFSQFRDHSYRAALADQPKVIPVGWETALKAVGAGLLSVGTTLVGTSFYQLGITGTFLGDYFGILMKERVTGFPFNILEDPMYVGATMNFLGKAVFEGSPAGALLSAWVWVVYYISTRFFEGPFTTKIYAEKAEADAKKEKDA